MRIARRLPEIERSGALPKVILPIGGVLGLFFLLLYALSCGTLSYSVWDTAEIIFCRGMHYVSESPLVPGIAGDVIWYLRLPRLLLAMLAGAGLALAGAVMQAIMRNPLADPYLLGVSSGAGLGATAAIALHIGAVFGRDSIGVFAFLGALGSSLLLIGIASLHARQEPFQLLLAGLGIHVICSACISLFVAVGADEEGIQSITYWLMGSLLMAHWQGIFVLGCVLFGAGAFFLSQANILNLMLLDDDTAATLGVNLSSYRRAYIVVVAILVGTIVYYSGMIGFVGLVTPHIVRRFCGGSHLLLLPFSMLAGACLVSWADLGSRLLLAGTDIPIGIMVSLVGGPVFVFLLGSKKYGFRG